LQYVGCEVEQPGQFVGMIDNVYSTMSGGYRPTVTLNQNTFNGPNRQTHMVVLEHPDYERMQSWAERVANTPAAQLIFARNGDNQDCYTQGIVIERASWGSSDTEWGYAALFPVTTSDSDTYAELLGDIADSPTGEAAPGEIILYESRAGSAVTHFVFISAPDFASLNNYLDTLFQSEDYADFNEEAAEIRSIGVRTQTRRVRTWEP
jgi:hypothetical protein